MSQEKEEFNIDALALKRKLSKDFSNRYFDKAGNFKYKKFREAEKRLGLGKKGTNPPNKKESEKNMKKDFDAVAMKRKLSRRLSKRIAGEDGFIDFEKLKKIRKERQIRTKDKNGD